MADCRNGPRLSRRDENDYKLGADGQEIKIPGGFGMKLAGVGWKNASCCRPLHSSLTSLRLRDCELLSVSDYKVLCVYLCGLMCV